MPVLREVLLELGINIDDENAEQTINNIRQSFIRMGRDGDTNAQGLRQSFQRVNNVMRSLSGVAGALGALFVGGKIAQGFGSMITQASDAVETTNKLNAVFEEAAPGIRAFSGELSTQIGQSKAQIDELVSSAGSLVKPILGSADAAAEMSKEVVKLSFDIASFENVKADDALVALRSALIGSSEPMLRFGVDTRVAALEQFALEEGVGKSIKQMTNAEVTALRLSLIQKRLGQKGATGDAARTAEQFANKMRALGGAFRDAAIEIGTEFLPIALDTLKTLVPMVKVIGTTLARAALFMIRIFRSVGRVFESTNTTSGKLNAVLFSVSAIAGITAIAFQALGAAAIKAAITTAAAWVVANLPLLAMIAGIILIITFIALLIEDFVAMGDGAESVTGTMIQGFSDLVDEVGSVPGAIWEMLKTAFTFWVDFFADVLGITDGFVGDLVSRVVDGFRNAFTRAKDLVVGLFSDEKVPNAIASGTTGAGRTPQNEAAALQTAARAAIDVGTKNAGASPLISPIPPTGIGPGVGPLVNNPYNEVSININTQSSASAEDIADMTGERISQELDRSNRQAQESFAIASEG